MNHQHQQHSNGHWYVAPFYSRGEFSPRLLMAWATLFFSFWLAYKAVAPPTLLAAQIVQPSPILGELVLTFVGLIASLLALGTFQKVRLDGPAIGPDTQTTILGNAAIGQQQTVSQQPLATSPAPTADSIPLPPDNE